MVITNSTSCIIRNRLNLSARIVNTVHTDLGARKALA